MTDKFAWSDTSEFPWGRSELVRKHTAQMLNHESRFGKLGELQTPEQKSALAEAIGKRPSPKTPKPPVPPQKKVSNNG